ncbi:MAG: hypothetical protein JJ863_29305 [Deltaproteobacteria bacterium]|nr:hypothetical protein [Deltaproteobacteria bacterium]
MNRLEHLRLQKRRVRAIRRWTLLLLGLDLLLAASLLGHYALSRFAA